MLKEALSVLEEGRGLDPPNFHQWLSPTLCCPSELESNVKLDVDGSSKNVNIPPRDMEEVVLPLCAWLKSLKELERPLERRVLVAVTGCGGVGKSTLCALLSDTCNRLWGSDGEWITIHNMDGYHLRNSILLNRTDSSGTPLIKYKGRTFTFDDCGFIRDLERLRNDDTVDVSLPVYDRELHQPVEDARAVLPNHRVILVEGIHLLSNEGEWAKAHHLFDRHIMLEAPLSACYRAVIDRKLKTVGNRDDCEVYFLRVYKPVFYDVKAQRFRADIIIEFDGGEDRKFQLRAVQVPQFRHPIEIEANKACNSGILRTPLNGQSPSEKQLLFVGVNPALQRLMKLGSDIKVGNVNRAEQILDGIGGKGQNSAVAVSHLMSMFKKGVVCAPPCVAMFAGGDEGEALVDFLQKKGIGIISQPCVAQTRVCYTITGGKMPATELVGTWEGQISNVESNNFLQLLSKFCKNQNNLQGIGIMGSLPPGISEDNFYSGVLNVFVSNLPPHEKPKVLLDSIHGLPNALQVGFVDILKINADELFGPISTSLNLKPPPSKTSGGDELEEVDIMNDIAFLSLAILDLFPSLSWIGVTDGPREAALFGRKQSGVGIDCYTFVLPTDNLNNCEEFLYPTGAGDTCSAVTLSEWVNGRPIHDAFKVGLAAASASCIQPENANFKFDDMCSIYERTIWTKMFFRWQ